MPPTPLAQSAALVVDDLEVAEAEAGVEVGVEAVVGVETVDLGPEVAPPPKMLIPMGPVTPSIKVEKHSH